MQVFTGIVATLIVLVLLALWINAIADNLFHITRRAERKLLWFLVLLIFPLVGMIPYYLFATKVD